MKQSRVIQVNKQSTIVKVNNGCCKRKKQRCFKKKLTSRIKKISGRIFQMCGTEPKVYFRSVFAKPSALIQIENKSNCIMEAIVQLDRKHRIRQTIEREQQVSIHVPSIKSLKIQCLGDDNSYCRGYYSLCLS